MSPQKPRVVVVGRGAPERGGIASYMSELMTSSLVDVVEFHELNLSPRGDLGAGGAMSLSNTRRTISDARALWSAAADADIVHYHSALAPTSTLLRAGLFSLVARLRGASVLVHAHGGRFASYSDSLIARLLARICLLPVSRVVTVATAVNAALVPIAPSGKVMMISNGVDTTRFVQKSEEVESLVGSPPVVLFVGHMTERKGVLDLLTASEELIARGVEHQLHLLGGRSDDGDAEYERIASLLDAAPDHVKVLGTVEPAQMPDVYDAADIYCLPSWWEAMPLSILEAMASGLPVVATDVGDVAEMLGDQCGLIVPVRDVSALSDAIQSLLRDRPRRVLMGQSARSRVEDRYSDDETFDALRITYLELVGES